MFTLKYFYLVVLAIFIENAVANPLCGEIVDDFVLKPNEVKSFLFNQTERENCFRFSIKRLTDYDLNDDISFQLNEVVNKAENSIIFTLMNRMANMKKLTSTGHCFLAESRNKDIIFNNSDFTNFYLQSVGTEITLRHEFTKGNFSAPFLKYNGNLGFQVNNFVVSGGYSLKGHWQIKLADCTDLPK